MNLELAKLFANLGFKYDPTTLRTFRKDLNDLARDIKSTSKTADSHINSIGTSLSRSTSKVDSFTKRIRGSYSKVKPSLEKMQKDLEKINRTLDGGHLDANQTKVYQDLHERVLAAISREEKKRLASIERARKATERAQEAEARKERALARERQRSLDAAARIRQQEMRQRLRDVLARKRTEEAAERSRHQQALRDIRIEGREARRASRRFKRGLLGVGGALGALGGIYSLKESTKQYQNYQGSMAGLTAATGSAEKAQKDFEWLHGLSDRLGVFMGDTTKGYTSLAANTRNAGIDDKTTKDVFEGILSYGRVLNLSKDDTDGVLRALSQMVGKGKLSAEEVRQQAGERLPGFIPAAARAMGFGEGEEGAAKFYKALESGKLTAKQLFPGLSKELMKMANSGDALAKSMNTTSAAVGRLQTNIWMANKTFNEAGFDRTVRNLANTMSESSKKMELVWVGLGKFSTVVGTALETPIELVGTLSSTIQDLFKDNPALKRKAEQFAAIITLAFAPLRKLFAYFWVVPAGLSALNDLIQSWRDGNLGQKSWKELGTEIGLATAALIIVGGTIYKVAGMLKTAASAARDLKGSLGGMGKGLGNVGTVAGNGYGRSSGNSSRGPVIVGGDGPRYGERAKPQSTSRTSKYLKGGSSAVLGAGLVASMMIPENDGSRDNGILDYAQKGFNGGAMGNFIGNIGGGYGKIIGTGLGVGYGLGTAYGENTERNYERQITKLLALTDSFSDLYQSGGATKQQYDNIGSVLKNPLGSGIKGLQSLGVSDNTISSGLQFMNDPTAFMKSLQPTTNVGTQYNAPHIEKVELNITTNAAEEVRYTVEDVLQGHFRSASSSTPITEY